MKKLTSFIASLIFLSSIYAQTPLNSSCLKAYYEFSGNANDITGNGYNGTVSNATLTTDRYGNANSAYAFNGTSSYIELGDIFDYPARTINLWVSINDIQNIEPHIYISDNPNISNGFTQIKTKVYQGDSSIITKSCDVYQISPFQIQLHTWYMVTITADSSKVCHYINGELISTTNPGTAHSVSNGHSLALLGTSRIFDRYFNGKIDDVSIYDFALEQNQISTLLTKIEEPEKEEISVLIYPNPTSDLLHIEGLDESQFSISIYNMLGQQIIMVENKKIIDLSLYQKGIYIIQIRDKKGTLIETRKVIKK